MKKYALPKWDSLLSDRFNVLDAENWITTLPLSPHTRRMLVYACFKTPFREATRGGVIKVNPLAELRAPADRMRSKDIFSIAELGKLFPRDWDKLTEVWGNFRTGVMFSLLAYTGLRQGALRALQWADVRGGYLVVSRAVKRGGEIGPLKKREVSKEQRVVHLLPHLVRFLNQLRPESRPNDLIFASEVTGKPY